MPLLPKTREMLSNIAKAKRLAASNIPVTIVGGDGYG
ncbi:regulatory protein [Salmonella enterica subsp. enterica]|uniref:Regulatory protein n=1 Tax=Salmonella enterica I TaxID=59201 RepID=A0A379WQN4_SALET|nr:regulatory protein [Salmonella enterica subsp. enterica]